MLQALTPTPSATSTPAPTETATPPPTVTATQTPKPTSTATSTPSPTPTVTPEPRLTPSPEPSPTPTVAEPEAPTAETGQEQQAQYPQEPGQGWLADQINAMLDGREGLYAIAIDGPGQNLKFRRAADEQIESASLYKLGIMVELFRMREEEDLDFEQPVVLRDVHFSEGGDIYDESQIGDEIPIGDLLRNMITFSSNVAGWALLDFTGNEPVNATLRDLGLRNTEIRWRPRAGSDPPDMASYAALPGISATVRADQAFNVTTAGDMALLFKLLLAGQVVSPEASVEMLDLLAEQKINNRLPALLPPDVRVAHKTGNLPPDLTHDAGVIYAPAGPVVVAVLTEGVPEWGATVFMQELALLVYHELGG